MRCRRFIAHPNHAARAPSPASSATSSDLSSAEEEEEEEEEEEAMYTIIPTHPALKHLKQIFKKNAKYTKLTTLLIVTRKGGENIRQG